jgi:hypothetical protein
MNTESKPLIDPQVLNTILARVISESTDDVRAWSRGQPGKWGVLAGQAIIASKVALGRKLSEDERRLVWASLWEHLTKLH